MTASPLVAQRADGSKLSAWVQQKVYNYQKPTHRTVNLQPQLLTAFVKTTNEQVLEQYGCKIYAQLGGICIATIPLSSIADLSQHPAISRIEASPSANITLDSVAKVVNVLPAYEAKSHMPFTGKGVVMGLMDVGFDLTHPTFYNDQTLSSYRIKRFWDQLAPSTDESTLPVGCEYVTQEEILTKAYATDGLTQNHGSHTAGTAAGSGYDSPFRGIAYESDICLVANAITADTIYIDPKDYEKYTSATDALGFKYIFDYAESCNMPCVISFSEGYTPYLDEDDQLYSEFLENLIGPGRILIASAGNVSLNSTYMEKKTGTEAAGAFLRAYEKNAMYRILSDGAPTLHFIRYAEDNTITHEQRLSLNVQWEEGKPLEDTLFIYNDTCAISIQRYTTSLTNGKTMYLMTMMANRKLHEMGKIALVVKGADCLAEVYGSSSYLLKNYDTDNRWNAAQIARNILSPGCLNAPVCVGATTYRFKYTNAEGKEVGNSFGDKVGEWATFSSVGPSMNGLMKPEVVAPGNNVLASYSSYYMEKNPTETSVHVAYSTVNDRTYPWGSNSGTSMSTPVVAGAVAIWLQANPLLTRNDIIEILQKTCRHPEEGLSYPNHKYGYGEIDIYSGLLEVLKASSIEGLSMHQPQQVMVYAKDGLLHLEFAQPCIQPIDIRIYALDGHLAVQKSITATKDKLILPLPTLPPGIYAVQLNGDKNTTGSQLIRL